MARYSASQARELIMNMTSGDSNDETSSDSENFESSSGESEQSEIGVGDNTGQNSENGHVVASNGGFGIVRGRGYLRGRIRGRRGRGRGVNRGRGVGRPPVIAHVNDNDSDSDAEVAGQMNWVPANGQQPVIPPFTGNAGVLVDTDNFEPIDFFKLFVTDDLLNSFVCETNRKAHQYIAQHPNMARYSSVHTWTDTNVTEMKKFLGLTFLMGLVKKPRIHMYWSTAPSLYTPIFKATMLRNRFQLLLRFWHFNDDTNLPNPQDVNQLAAVASELDLEQLMPKGVNFLRVEGTIAPTL